MNFGLRSLRGLSVFLSVLATSESAYAVLPQGVVVAKMTPDLRGYFETVDSEFVALSASDQKAMVDKGVEYVIQLQHLPLDQVADCAWAANKLLDLRKFMNLRSNGPTVREGITFDGSVNYSLPTQINAVFAVGVWEMTLKAAALDSLDEDTLSKPTAQFDLARHRARKRRATLGYKDRAFEVVDVGNAACFEQVGIALSAPP
jgi:hypothetical protein